MDNDILFIILFAFIFSMICLFAKKNIIENIFCIIGTIILSFIILNVMYPPFKRGGRPIPPQKACFYRQRDLGEALASIYNPLPEKMNVDEIAELEKNVLVPRKYLRYPLVKNNIDCLYLIQNSELLCARHGSCNEKSSFFTDGKELDCFGDYYDLLQKRQDLKRQEEKIESEKFARKRNICAFVLFLLFLSFIKTTVSIFYKK